MSSGKSKGASERHRLAVGRNQLIAEAVARFVETLVLV